MSKINRFDGNYKAFASEQLTNERTTFGTEVISDDLTAQQTPEYLRGMGIVGQSQFPTLQDFNAVNYAATQSIAYLHQMGVPEWNGEQEYQIGSATNRNGALYFCQTADHASATPPESDAVNWIKDSKDKVIHVNNIAALESLDLTNIEAVFVGMYHNITDTSGGGLLIKATGRHNGGAFFDPSRPFPADWSNQIQLEAWFADSGVDVVGFRRIGSREPSAAWFGAKSDVTYDQTKPVQKSLDTLNEVYLNSGTYYFNGLKIPSGKKLVGVAGNTIVKPIAGATVTVDAQQENYVDSRLSLEKIIFDGSDSPTTTGLKVGNITGLSLIDITINSFSSGIGLLYENSNVGWTENSFVQNLKMAGNATNIVFDRQGTGTDSYGYTFFNNVFINLVSGQTGIKLLNGSRIYNSSLMGVTFAYSGGGTGFDMTGGSINDAIVFDVREEGAGGTLVVGGEVFEQSKFSKTYANGKSILWRTAQGGSASILRVDSSNNTILGSISGLDRFIWSGSESKLDIQVNGINWTNRNGTPINQSLLGPTPINDAPLSNTAMRVARDETTNRSISASGTVNASGADYAEYEYNNGLVISKGDIVGFKEDGALTDVYSESIRFAVKSTDPAIVGGDTLNTKHERAFVDRVAYSGKVPVNIQGAVSGQYVLATASSDGGITGELVDTPSFEQYLKCVGRVNRVLSDGRAEIAVIIH